MTDLYVRTRTQDDYNALMRLADASGFNWEINKPCDLNNWGIYKEDTVVRFDGSAKVLVCASTKHFQNDEIMEIQNLAGIRSIFKVSRGNWESFVEKYGELHTARGTCISSLANSAPCCAIIQTNGIANLYLDTVEVYSILAIEYKPKTTQATSILPKYEKVAVSECLFKALKNYGLPEEGFKDCPVNEIAHIYYFWKEHESSLLSSFIDHGLSSQWKLIDAMRYGYKSESEQLYYVPLVKGDAFSFLNIWLINNETKADTKTNDKYSKTKFTMPEIEAIDPRYKAFAVPVEEEDK